MKKMSTWKLLFLITITLGIYSIFWFINTRKELMSKYKQEIPHWSWLIWPWAVSLPAALIVLVTIAITAMSAPGADSLVITLATFGIIILGILIPYLIGAWWMWVYGGAVEFVTNSRVPKVWTLLYYLFYGPYIAVVHQYYFNRYSMGYKKLQSTPKKKPTQKFILISSVLVFLSLVVTVLTSPDYSKEIDLMKRENQKTIDHYENINKLQARYDTCVDDLYQKYPDEVSTDQTSDYEAAYDECEVMRNDLNRAIES